MIWKIQNKIQNFPQPLRISMSLGANFQPKQPSHPALEIYIIKLNKCFSFIFGKIEITIFFWVKMYIFLMENGICK